MHEIKHKGKLLAIVDSINNFEPGLTFYGSKKNAIQVGAFWYNSGKILKDHRHIERKRKVNKTEEILIVLKGAVEVRTFSEKGKTVVDTRNLQAGEFYILYNGGVGYTVRANDTKLLEVKPGPYEVDDDDLERELI